MIQQKVLGKCRICSATIFALHPIASDVNRVIERLQLCVKHILEYLDKGTQEARQEGFCARCWSKPAVTVLGYCFDCHEWIMKELKLIEDKK